MAKRKTKRPVRKNKINSTKSRKFVQALVAAPSRPKRVVVRRKPSVEELMARRGIMMNTDTKLVYQNYLKEKEKARQYHKYKEMNLSPHTREQLGRIASIQNKSKTDDYKRQRIKREQEILQKSMNILSTPYVFTDDSLDVTNVDDETNILMAPNVFKERDDNPHLLKTKKLNIMQTREAGNDLHF